MMNGSNIAEITVQHLLEINEGNCSITIESIEEVEDENIRYILTGLLFMHQDNVLMREELLEKNAARDLFEERLLGKSRQLFNKSLNLEESRRKLKAINEELNQFMHIASHDLKTPLSGIYTLASFIEGDLKEEKYDEINEHLDKLKNRVGRIDNLLNGILEYSKIEIDSLLIEEINIDFMLQDLIDYMDLPENFIVIAKTELPTIEGVRFHMEQLFSHFIWNAIKFNNKTSRTIEIDYRNDNEEHVFSFQDNGVGIEEKYFGKIFIAFQTLNPQDDLESTGLGLAIVKKIIDNLKGSIEVNSVINKGTQFIVRMPLKKVLN
jgi:light-regulated signal transduction histidine kinase (bacteriophytochrome)